jgi:hypothetical protein
MGNSVSAESLRAKLKDVGAEILILKKDYLTETSTGDKDLDGEVIANTVLAFRHVEDAAMRLGKVLQALDGGVSKYDNTGVVAQK